MTWPGEAFFGTCNKFRRRLLYLQLTKYIENIVDKFGMSDTNPSRILMDPGYTTNGESKLFQDVTLYRNLIGALLCVAINARPDIAASVRLLGRKMSSPTEADWMAAKRVVRYLKGTKNYKLHFGRRKWMEAICIFRLRRGRRPE